MKYTQIPSTAFQNIQLNAGILVDGFTPATGVIGNLLGATSGGVNFSDSVEYKDFGEDIDNCPKNMLELKKLDNHEVKMSGTFVTINATTAKWLAGSADVDDLDATHIIPRNDILASDFKDIWWIGDYSDVNTGDNAGFVAIHMRNALNTGGFQIQSTDKEKGKFAFEFTGHYSMAAQDTVPYEIYIQAGNYTPEPLVLLNKHLVTVAKDATTTLTAETYINKIIDDILAYLNCRHGCVCGKLGKPVRVVPSHSGFSFFRCNHIVGILLEHQTVFDSSHKTCVKTDEIIIYPCIGKSCIKSSQIHRSGR